MSSASGSDGPQVTDLVTRLATGFAEALNCCALLAAPRAFERASAVAVVDLVAMGQAIADLLGLIEQMKVRSGSVEGDLGSMVALAPELEALKQLLLQGVFSPEVTAQARRVVGSMAMPEPPGGWDQWDGSDPS